ncbi:hypothetical protein PISL3812_05481 [Talaromyces islandicus]|uniref:Uncharacterized protein n=1 Tax=Talaromyces islandicus TaxID=28573 RepID=A0A0U1M0F1_TALIS|nr:hypothetical protein PISL3812_05481 [Talaromyces islandicus]
MHQSKALNLTIQRIGSKRPQTEAMLAAVTTMAFAERLANRDVAWNIHIDGLAQMVKERHSKGMSLPWWLHDLVILDSINHVFNFPRVYHRKVINAIGSADSSLILQVVELCEGLIKLRQSIDTSNKYSNPGYIPYITQEIEAPFANLLHQALNLRKNSDNKAAHATAQAVEIILYLSCPWKNAPNLNTLADELKETLLQLPVRSCSYMDFTSCQHLIGAIASQHKTSTQAWFVNKLTSAAKAMRSRGWHQPFEVLEDGLQFDVRLTEWFRRLLDRGLE